MDFLIVFTIFIICVFLFVGISFYVAKKKRVVLSSSVRGQFTKKMNRITKAWNSYKEQIMDLDKLYHHILLEAGYEWSFWEILKKEPFHISDLQKIWDLHKLRNKLAHEFDEIADSYLREKAKEFEREIQKLLQNLK